MSQIATVLRLIALWAGFSFALAAQPIQVTSMPTGLKPLGIASMNYATPGLFYYGDYLVVANSGDNSVSVFSYDMSYGLPPSPVTVIQGISDPHAVVHYCGESAIGEIFADSYRFVVTSPSDNSVSVVQVNGSDAATSGRGSLSTTITRVPVGKQPVSAACFLQSSGKSVIAVSNYADRSVTLIDGASFKVTATVPGVPGNADLHGIGGPALGSVAWIVGTDANTLTLLDLNAAKVLSQISVQQPLAIQGTQVDTATGVLSFDPATLKPTPILAVPGVQVFASPGFGPGSSQIPFAISGNGAATSLNLISSGMLYAIPQASNPQDMMVQQTAFCYVTSRICMYSDAQLIVTSRDSNSLIVIPAPAVPRDFAVVNAGNTTTLVAPGSLASIYVPTGVSQAFFADTSPLPASLGGVTLRIGGSLQLTPSAWLYPAVNSVQARLLYVDQNQINFQVPPGLATGSAVPLQLQKPDGTTVLTTLRIGATAPGIFTVLVNGRAQAAVLNQDNTLNAPDNPAARGTVIQIFATGGGDTTPLLGPGEAAPVNGDPLATTNAQPTVMITGPPLVPNVSAPVIFSGLAPGLVGVCQINAVIPQEATPGTARDLYVSSGNGYSQSVTIAIE